MSTKILPLLLMIPLFVACTSNQVPSVATPDVQASAIAMAMTFSAQTLTAQPRATPSPTETFSPTPSPLLTISPTLTSTLLPTPTETAAPSTCDKPLASRPAGTIAEVILIRNESGSDALVSLWLAPTPFGECGYRGFNIPKGGTVSTALPLGCYTVTAYISAKGRNYSLSQGGLCFNNTDKWTFVIRPNRLLLLPP
ncbi:MAG: hypothetical protein ACK8QZ_00025 [Anaerolineales bacterium]